MKTLVNKFYNPGLYNTNWDGLDNFGNKVCSGIYFYCFESIDFKQVKKALFLK